MCIYFAIMWSALSIEGDPQSGLAILIFGPVGMFTAVLTYFPVWLLVTVASRQKLKPVSTVSVVTALVLTACVGASFTHIILVRSNAIVYSAQQKQIRETRDAAIKEAHEKISKLVRSNPGQELSVLKDEFRKADDEFILFAIADSKFASAELLHNLATIENIVVLNYVASNPNTSARTLEWIFEQFSVSKRTDVHHTHFNNDLLRHPNLTEELRIKLQQLAD